MKIYNITIFVCDIFLENLIWRVLDIDILDMNFNIKYSFIFLYLYNVDIPWKGSMKEILTHLMEKKQKISNW